MKSPYMKWLLLILPVILLISSCRSTKEAVRNGQEERPDPVSPLAVMFDTSEVFSSNLTGFALYDPVEDSMLYAQNEDKYFTPASNTKLFTFYAGLKLLPDTLRGLEYTERGDSLIFWGTGDPSFLHPDFETDSVYNFLKEYSGDLYYSDSHFRDELLGPGWAWSDYNYYYSAEKSPMPMYGNVVRFTVEVIEQRHIKEREDGKTVSPKFFRSFIEERSGEDDDPMLFREMNDNRFKYRPRADTSTYEISRPFHYEPDVVADMLSDTLGKQVRYTDLEKPDSTQILYSIPADTVYRRMLHPSDNFVAEQLLLLAASELGKPLDSREVIDFMKDEYLFDLPDDPQWEDGSGLSRYNLFTPRSLIHLLVKIDDEFAYDEELFPMLPAGGESGTIQNWYAGREGGPPYVFAKTGTLRNNHCLSGYLVTESGRKLMFSFMNNHYVTSSSVVKEEMEKVLWYIHKNH